MNVPVATEQETKRFLEILWIEFGDRLVRAIATAYSLSDEQYQALKTVLVKPNDWKLEISPSLC